MSQEKPLIDESQWPEVLVTYPSVIDDRMLQCVLQRQEEFFRRGEPYTLIVDARAGGAPSRAQRRLISEHMIAHREQVQRLLRACAMVMSSPAVRGAVAALQWLNPPLFPVRMFSSLDQARAWTSELLAPAPAYRTTG